MTTTAARTAVRQLPPEEFHRLADLPIASRDGIPDPLNAAILVAEDDGVIVGTWAATTCVHLEGLWIHPDYRRKWLIAGHLLRAMKAVLRSLGIRYSFTLVDDPEVLLLAHKAGFTRLRYDICLLDLGEGEPPCPSPPSSR